MSNKQNKKLRKLTKGLGFTKKQLRSLKDKYNKVPRNGKHQILTAIQELNNAV